MVQRRVISPIARLVVAAALLASLLAIAAPAVTAAPTPFTASGSILQIYSHGHAVGASVELRGSAGQTLATKAADAQGAVAFRELAPGVGYTVVDGGQISDPLTVTGLDDHPSQDLYTAAAELPEGFGYITARDGTSLSVNVTYPKNGAPKPWPVVVDYSGYEPSKPGATPPEATIYPYFGYVVVGVNMRGTTCSGGAFWFFEEAQRTDGYDVIETLANQPWSNGNVGMVGISYSGYSQLYVAATQPPHLRAITPLSPFSDGYRGILYPGGILNDGFARDWAVSRQNDSRPNAKAWVRNRIAGGDTICEQNQVMRLQSQDIAAEIIDGRFNDPQYRYLDPGNFASLIDVPTYLATQWQDEQTGGYGAELADLIPADSLKRATFTNGSHVDSLGPDDFMRVAEFIDLYVGKRVPTLEAHPGYQGVVAASLGDLFGTPIPEVRWTSPGHSTYPAALAAYEAESPIRIRWENGSVPGREGKPYGSVTSTYPSWPVPSTAAERWYLQPDGELGRRKPAVADADARSASTYTYDASTKRRKTFDGSTEGMWAAHPDVHWSSPPEGTALSFTTPRFGSTTPYLGGGSADLWLRSSAADTDVEVTLTEVRGDGSEVYIQSGWLRASRRHLDPAESTVVRPSPTYQAGDAEDLPAGEFVPVRIELFPFAHIFRPGSRLRVNIEAPGGNQPFWAFSALPGTARNEIGHSTGRPSSIVLSRLPDTTVTTGAPRTAPSCDVAGVTTQSQSLRNQPCRRYRPDRIPTHVGAFVGPGTIDVTWTASPASSVPITGYTVTVLPSGQEMKVAGDTSALLYEPTGPGPYAFRVTADYDGLRGPASSASAPVAYPAEPGIGPDAVPLIRVVPGNTQARIGWLPPTDDHGSPVTGYVVRPYRDGVAQAARVFRTNAFVQTITGLTNGTDYTFTVAAINANGTGPTAVSRSITPHPTIPVSTRITSATTGNGAVSLAWFPAYGNGSPVNGYLVTPYRGTVAQRPHLIAGTGTTAVIRGLANGERYTFRVAAVNGTGTAKASALVPSLVVGAPGPVSFLRATAAGVTVTVNWFPPTANGRPVTGYRITPYRDGVAEATRVVGRTSRAVISGLRSGATYTFKVVAVNPRGGGQDKTSPAVTTGR